MDEFLTYDQLNLYWQCDTNQSGYVLLIMMEFYYTIVVVMLSDNIIFRNHINYVFAKGFKI